MTTFTLCLCSDLHLHRPDQHDALASVIAAINAQHRTNLLICAGDISHRMTELAQFFNAIHLPCPKVFVPGNVDLWVIDPESSQDTAHNRYHHMLPKTAREHGWFYLPSGPLVLETHRLAVVGTTGWFSGGACFSEWRNGDATEEDDTIARWMAEDLHRQIAMVKESCYVIVVTHHLPHPACLPAHLNQRPGLVNRHLQAVLERHTERIILVVHGHHHRRYPLKNIGPLPYIAHPFGYPEQHERIADGFCTIDIDTALLP